MKQYRTVLILLSIFFLGLVGGCLLVNVLSQKSFSNVAVAKEVVRQKPVQAEITQKEVANASVFLFYSKNCSSCDKIKPVWYALQKEFKNDYNFYEIDVDMQKNAPLCIEFLVTTIPSIYIEDVPFRNRAYINPAMYGYLPRFEEELSRYLDVRKILKKGVKSES